MRKEVKKKYTEIIKELDLIISKLDSSDIPIEQSIKLHEKGVELSKEAEKELNLSLIPISEPTRRTPI